VEPGGTGVDGACGVVRQACVSALRNDVVFRQADATHPTRRLGHFARAPW